MTPAPKITPYKGTISSTSYPATAQIPDVGFDGFFAATHLGKFGDPDILVSLDGTTDHMRLVAGTPGAGGSTQAAGYRTAFFKLATAGSADVLAHFEMGRSS